MKETQNAEIRVVCEIRVTRVYQQYSHLIEYMTSYSTLTELLSLISQNLKMSLERYHAHSRQSL